MKKSKYIEKIALEAVQMESLAIIKNICFDMFTVGNLQNIFREHDNYLISNDFWHKRKIDNFDPYYVLVTIATNISVQLVTFFFFLSMVTYWFQWKQSRMNQEINMHKWSTVYKQKQSKQILYVGGFLWERTTGTDLFTRGSVIKDYIWIVFRLGVIF